MGSTSNEVSVQAHVTVVTYEPPRIIVLGTVAELTRTGSGRPDDHSGMGSKH
jgi:hypothetical protein